jgi:hypothetical protein
VQDPVQGSQQTIYVVGLQYVGTMENLQQTGYQIAMDEAKHGISMQRIEEDARLMLSHTPTGGLGDDLVDDVIEEFYPEEVRVIAADTVDMVTGEVIEQKRHRRTKEEIAADKAAAAAVVAAPEVATTEVINDDQPEVTEPEPETGPAPPPPFDDDDFPPPPANKPGDLF